MDGQPNQSENKGSSMFWLMGMQPAAVCPTYLLPVFLLPVCVVVCWHEEKSDVLLHLLHERLLHISLLVISYLPEVRLHLKHNLCFFFCSCWYIILLSLKREKKSPVTLFRAPHVPTERRHTIVFGRDALRLVSSCCMSQLVLVCFALYSWKTEFTWIND